MTSPTFRRGGQAAEEAAKKVQSGGNRNKFFSLKEKESAVIRFIDDGDPETGWISVGQHAYVPTKGPDENVSDEAKEKWPQRAGAVCRHDDAFSGMYRDCFICDQMTKEDGKPYFPSIRLWARAVLREPVLGTQEHVDAGQIKPHMIGKVVGYDDVYVTDGETGQQRPEVVILNFGLKNFFGTMQGYYDVNGTVLDRDFHVTRKGQGKDTDYSIIARDPIYDQETGAVYDLRDPEIRAQYEGIVDLEKLIADQASDDRYARYFDTTKPIPARRDRDEDAPAAPTSASAPKPAANEPSEEAMMAMRNRVMGIGKPQNVG
jgi:hypothetical protein